MVDIAKVAFEADTVDLKTAAKDLKALKPAAKDVEKASDAVAKSTDRMGDQYTKLIPKTKQVETRFQKLARGGNLVSKSFKGVLSVARNLKAGLLGFATGIVAAFSFSALTRGALELSAAMAELSTLLPPGTARLNEMQAAARAMADEFGTNAAFQLKAFYGAVSAGATSTAQAIGVIDAANKLAIGGITDVTTGVDILTTATNAYASSGLKAGDASDALFTGMKAGKTTISELASGLGNVIPIAASLGIKFDELVAGTAALTLQGLSTSTAITSLRAILSGIAKPTSEAAKMAKALGIDFSTTALRAKGLSGFLADVVEKSGGAADKLSVLFGSVEALNAALAFSGSGGEAFNEILGKMQNKAGETDTAFKKVTDSLNFRWNKLLSSMGNLAVDFGTKILSIIVPIGEGIQSLYNDTSTLLPVVKALSVVIVTIASTALPSLIASLVTLVSTFSLATTATTVFTAAITAARFAMIALGGPIGIVFGLIGGAASAWVLFSEKSADAETAMYDAAKGSEALNKALSIFNVSAAPNAAKNAINIANSNYKLAQSAVAAASAELSKVRALNASAEARLSAGGGVMPFGTAMGIEKETVSIQRLNAAENSLLQTRNELQRTAQTVTGSLFGQEDVIADLTNVKKITVSIGGITSAAGSAKKALTELQQIAKGFGELSEPFNQASSAVDAAKSAMENGIITNDQYVDSLTRIQDAFLKTGGSASQWSKIVGDNTDNISSKMEDLAKNSIGGLSSEIANLVVDGKANFADLAKSIVKSLIKIAVQALITKAITMFFGFSGGGTFGGGATGAPMKLTNAKGNAFDDNVIPFRNGGTFTNTIVTKPTPFTFAKGSAFGEMGEAGPEAIMPLERGPDGSLGVQMFGGSGKSSTQTNNVEVNNVYKMEGAVSEEKIVNSINQAGNNTKKQVKSSVIGWLQEYDQNGTL